MRFVKFIIPILQAIIALAIIGILGWGMRGYAKFEGFDRRLGQVETQNKGFLAEFKRLNDRIEKLPLCRK